MKTAYAPGHDGRWQFDTALQAKRICDKFFADCESTGTPPTVSGLALALGTTVGTLKKWLYGDVTAYLTDLSEEKRVEVAEGVGEAMMRIMKYAEEAAYDKDKSKGAIKILSDIFGIVPVKGSPEKLELVLPDSLKELAK